jgi:AraC family ethanolamine operon transcriptional activator
VPLNLERHTAALISAGAPSFRGVEELDAANRDIGWTIEYRQLESGGCSASFLMSEHHGMIFSGESFGTRVHILAEVPRGAFNFVVPITGGDDCQAQGHVFGEEDLLLFPPGSEVDIVTPGAAGDLMLTVADADLQYVAALLFPGSQLFAKPDGQIHPGRAGRLAAVSAGITEAASDRSTDPESLSELLARCIALVADSAGTPTDMKLVGNDAKGKVVARAREFIEGSFAQAVRLEDLCRHAGVGVRVLQRVFRERLGVSPKQYIKVRRLNTARRLLAAGSPSETMVSEIARQCGYTHLGRFSLDYRSHFGETPRQTLRR